jgi:hypothetical protein
VKRLNELGYISLYTVPVGQNPVSLSLTALRLALTTLNSVLTHDRRPERLQA